MDWNNLQDFGFAAMAAGGQPGATTLGALGQGGLGMNQMALQRAQTQNTLAEAQNRQNENQLFPYNLKLMQQKMNLMGKYLGDQGSPDQPQANTTPAPNSTGMSWASTAGSTNRQVQPSQTPINNPGNLRPVGASTGFQTFDNPQDGLDQMRADLTGKISGKSPVMQSKYGKNYQPSLRNIIATYAPVTENDTASYIQNVSKATGISPNQILTVQDVDKLLPAMVKQEGNAAMLSQTNLSVDPEQSAAEALQKKINMGGILGISSPGDVEQLKATNTRINERAAKAAEIAAAKPKAEAEKEGENVGEAQKTYASISSRIDNAKKIIKKMKSLSEKMPDRGPFQKEVWLSKHLGDQKLEAAVNSFENLNENLFTQELPGVIPPGSKLDIPIVNALATASKVNPKQSHTSRIEILSNLEDLLDKAKANAQKNYGLLSGKELPMAEGTESVTSSPITHKYIPGKGIVPVGD